MRIALLLSFTALLLTGCSKPQVTFEESIRPIAWQQVHKSRFDQVRRLSGTVQPVEATNLSFQVGGKVAKVMVKLGDEVKKGQVLAQLDERTFRLSKQSAEASLAQAEASLTKSRNEFARYKELVEKGQVSHSGFDNAKAAFESASSNVDLTKAQLDIARKDLQDTLLIAPYDGKITKRIVEPSMQISPGSAAFEIEGIDGMEVQVMVPETLIRDLSQGMTLAIHYPALVGVEGKGIITEIGSRAQSANAFPVAVVIESPGKDLRAGMTAEVDFTFEGVGRTGFKGDSIKIPVSAIMAGQGQTSFVFIYDEQAKVVNKRQVQTENLLNNEVFISDGLKEGDIIATAGVNYLRDGQKVTLLDEHLQRFN